jgi:hypothetical protein
MAWVSRCNKGPRAYRCAYRAGHIRRKSRTLSASIITYECLEAKRFFLGCCRICAAQMLDQLEEQGTVAMHLSDAESASCYTCAQAYCDSATLYSTCMQFVQQQSRLACVLCTVHGFTPCSTQSQRRLFSTRGYNDIDIAIMTRTGCEFQLLLYNICLHTCWVCCCAAAVQISGSRPCSWGSLHCCHTTRLRLPVHIHYTCNISAVGLPAAELGTSGPPQAVAWLQRDRMCSKPYLCALCFQAIHHMWIMLFVCRHVKTFL